jgi:hypothetical protein
MRAIRRIVAVLGAAGAVVLAGWLAPRSSEVGRAATPPASPTSATPPASPTPPTSATPPTPGTATVTLSATGRPIPPGFLGLSIEFKELQTYEKEGPLFLRVISLLKPEDGSPVTLRIGGKSADHVYWNATTAKPPQWVSVIGQPWLDRLNTLVRAAGAQVMLDLNLAVHSPVLEADFVQAAEQTLPHGSLTGLEIGNEPDLYWRQTQLEKQRIPSTKAATDWAANYSPTSYRADYASYARLLATQFPGLPIGGPELISAKPQWLSAVESLGPLAPQFLTIHRYAASTCFKAGSPYYPTVPMMLDEKQSAGLAQTVSGAVSQANAHHQALRLTEVNSVSCGGNQGVADSFATALWAPDALFEMIRAGVASVDWHIRPATLNAPFLALPTAIAPLPEMYGLAVFSQMTRPGAVLLGAKESAAKSVHLKAWAVRFVNGTRILLINKGPVTAATTLKGAPAGHAFLKRLTAPAVGSTSGVTFGGQTIGADARWHGTVRATLLQPSAGSYTVTVPGYSAALLTVYR